MKKKNEYYGVSVDDTKNYGIIKAAIIGRIRFWCGDNKKKKLHFHYGVNWSGYLSADDLEEQIGIPRTTIIKNLKSLIDEGIIYKHNFNIKSYDRTGWYCIEKPRLPQSQPLTPTESTLTPTESTIPVNLSGNLSVNHKEDHNILGKIEFDNIYVKILNQCNQYFKNNVIEILNSGTGTKDELQMLNSYCKNISDVKLYFKLKEQRPEGVIYPTENEARVLDL